MVFRKIRLKSISAVEYVVDETVIRTSTQIEIEEVIMKENASRFSLAYSYPVFSKNIIVKELIYRNIPISTKNAELNRFLSLLYQPYPKLVSAHINLDHWNNHWIRSREKTASSYSGLYFRYYKV